MKVKTGRFGELTVGEEEVITVPQGILGFPDQTQYCLVDPDDDTLILWLQSIEHPDLAFPVLEPKVFKPDYAVRLSAMELRELKMENVNQSAVFSILTIPESVQEMTANLKAPIVINLKEKIAKQVVLQENEYSIKHSMFKELRAHLATIASQSPESKGAGEGQKTFHAVPVNDIPPSLTVRTLR